MKETLKDFGNILLDIALSILIAFIALHVFLSVIAFSVFAGGGGPIEKEPKLTPEQEIVAQTILGEARGEGKRGMYAVACVIAQRAAVKKKTPTQVCLQERKGVYQFSCWNEGDKNREVMKRLVRSDTPEAEYARQLAIYLFFLDRRYTNFADHYCTRKTHNYWTKGQVPVRIIGNHKFYKLYP